MSIYIYINGTTIFRQQILNEELSTINWLDIIENNNINVKWKYFPGSLQVCFEDKVFKSKMPR